jgi:hypothetical protein
MTMTPGDTVTFEHTANLADQKRLVEFVVSAIMSGEFSQPDRPDGVAIMAAEVNGADCFIITASADNRDGTIKSIMAFTTLPPGTTVKLLSREEGSKRAGVDIGVFDVQDTRMTRLNDMLERLADDIEAPASDLN